MKNIKLYVKDITCANCALTIEKHFSSLNINAKVLVSIKKVIIDYDETKYDVDYLVKELKKIGYHPVFNQLDLKIYHKQVKINLLISIIFTIPLLLGMISELFSIMMLDIFMNQYLQLVCASVVLFYCGRKYIYSFFKQLINLSFGMDTLVFIGSFLAYVYSIIVIILSKDMMLYFESIGVIITLVLTGQLIETKAKEKTSKELTNLQSLQVQKALRVKGDITEEVSIFDCKIGDILLVKSNCVIPTDGIIEKGETYVDESSFTGEFVSVFKKEGDQVIGSTLNTTNPIYLKVDKDINDNSLSKIIQNIEEMSLIKPSYVRIADKISGYFVPVILLIGVITLIVKLSIGVSFSESFINMISVIVVSCPCALGLATPLSISVSSSISYKNKILFHDAKFFEMAYKTNVICFDKTGTLTEGNLYVVDKIILAGDLTPTLSLEQLSNHPIASGILQEKHDLTLKEVSEFKDYIGYGVSGIIDSKLVLSGSKEFMVTNNIPLIEIPAENERYTAVYTAIDGKIVNALFLDDKIKDKSKQLISWFKKRNIKTVMISGDKVENCAYISNLLGIDEYHGSCKVNEKSDIIKSYQDQGLVVGFVGDGTNDSAGLSMSDVSFSVSNSNNIAKTYSGINIVDNDLSIVSKVISISKNTKINIYLNFLLAFLYNIIMIPLAILGQFTPILSAIGMSCSSLLVIINSLLLNFYKIGGKYDY